MQHKWLLGSKMKERRDRARERRAGDRRAENEKETDQRGQHLPSSEKEVTCTNVCFVSLLWHCRSEGVYDLRKAGKAGSDFSS